LAEPIPHSLLAVFLARSDFRFAILPPSNKSRRADAHSDGLDGFGKGVACNWFFEIARDLELFALIPFPVMFELLVTITGIFSMPRCRGRVS